VEIWHLALAREWNAAATVGAYRMSTLGATLDDVGYVHASRPAQAPGVAARFYADVADPLVILVMDDDAVRESGTNVKYEDAGTGEMFPHIYGPIDPTWVREVLPAYMADGRLVIDGRAVPGL